MFFPKGAIMTPNIFRVLGILLLLGAAVFAVLNLHRVANLGLPWVAPVLLIVGIGLTTASRRPKR
jgi:hypothetical protein